MVKFIIYEYVDYEGWFEAFEGTKKECREWLIKKLKDEPKGGRPSILDDLVMYRVPHKDMIEEMWERIKSKPD